MKDLSRVSLTTFIHAPAERVFDLSRSIDLHTISTAQTQERAVAGKTTGLIELDETVTWQARHLFKERQFTSRITAMERPVHFTDEMIQGDFKSFKHWHQFIPVNDGISVIDIIEFESPYGIIGKLFNRIWLKKHLFNLIIVRNEVIKEWAETDKWKKILS